MSSPRKRDGREKEEVDDLIEQLHLGRSNILGLFFSKLAQDKGNVQASDEELEAFDDFMERYNSLADEEKERIKNEKITGSREGWGTWLRHGLTGGGRSTFGELVFGDRGFLNSELYRDHMGRVTDKAKEIADRADKKRQREKAEKSNREAAKAQRPSRQEEAGPGMPEKAIEGLRQQQERQRQVPNAEPLPPRRTVVDQRRRAGTAPQKATKPPQSAAKNRTANAAANRASNNDLQQRAQVEENQGNNRALANAAANQREQQRQQEQQAAARRNRNQNLRGAQQRQQQVEAQAESPAGAGAGGRNTPSIQQEPQMAAAPPAPPKAAAASAPTRANAASSSSRPESVAQPNAVTELPGRNAEWRTGKKSLFSARGEGKEATEVEEEIPEEIEQQQPPKPQKGYTVRVDTGGSRKAAEKAKSPGDAPKQVSGVPKPRKGQRVRVASGDRRAEAAPPAPPKAAAEAGPGQERKAPPPASRYIKDPKLAPPPPTRSVQMQNSGVIPWEDFSDQEIRDIEQQNREAEQEKELNKRVDEFRKRRGIKALKTGREEEEAAPPATPPRPAPAAGAGLPPAPPEGKKSTRWASKNKDGGWKEIPPAPRRPPKAPPKAAAEAGRGGENQRPTSKSEVTIERPMYRPKPPQELPPPIPPAPAAGAGAGGRNTPGTDQQVQQNREASRGGAVVPPAAGPAAQPPRGSAGPLPPPPPGPPPPLQPGPGYEAGGAEPAAPPHKGVVADPPKQSEVGEFQVILKALRPTKGRKPTKEHAQELFERGKEHLREHVKEHGFEKAKGKSKPSQTERDVKKLFNAAAGAGLVEPKSAPKNRFIQELTELSNERVGPQQKPKSRGSSAEKRRRTDMAEDSEKDMQQPASPPEPAAQPPRRPVSAAEAAGPGGAGGRGSPYSAAPEPVAAAGAGGISQPPAPNPQVQQNRKRIMEAQKPRREGVGGSQPPAARPPAPAAGGVPAVPPASPPEPAADLGRGGRDEEEGELEAAPPEPAKGAPAAASAPTRANAASPSSRPEPAAPPKAAAEAGRGGENQRPTSKSEVTIERPVYRPKPPQELPPPIPPAPAAGAGGETLRSPADSIPTLTSNIAAQIHKDLAQVEHYPEAREKVLQDISKGTGEYKGIDEEAKKKLLTILPHLPQERIGDIGTILAEARVIGRDERAADAARGGRRPTAARPPSPAASPTLPPAYEGERGPEGAAASPGTPASPRAAAGAGRVGGEGEEAAPPEPEDRGGTRSPAPVPAAGGAPAEPPAAQPPRRSPPPSYQQATQGNSRGQRQSVPAPYSTMAKTGSAEERQLKREEAKRAAEAAGPGGAGGRGSPYSAAPEPAAPPEPVAQSPRRSEDQEVGGSPPAAPSRPPAAPPASPPSHEGERSPEGAAASPGTPASPRAAAGAGRGGGEDEEGPPAPPSSRPAAVENDREKDTEDKRETPLIRHPAEGAGREGREPGEEYKRAAGLEGGEAQEERRERDSGASVAPGQIYTEILRNLVEDYVVVDTMPRGSKANVKLGKEEEQEVDGNGFVTDKKEAHKKLVETYLVHPTMPGRSQVLENEREHLNDEVFPQFEKTMRARRAEFNEVVHKGVEIAQERAGTKLQVEGERETLDFGGNKAVAVMGGDFVQELQVTGGAKEPHPPITLTFPRVDEKGNEIDPPRYDTMEYTWNAEEKKYKATSATFGDEGKSKLAPELQEQIARDVREARGLRGPEQQRGRSAMRGMVPSVTDRLLKDGKDVPLGRFPPGRASPTPNQQQTGGRQRGGSGRGP